MTFSYRWRSRNATRAGVVTASAIIGHVAAAAAPWRRRIAAAVIIIRVVVAIIVVTAVISIAGCVIGTAPSLPASAHCSCQAAAHGEGDGHARHRGEAARAPARLVEKGQRRDAACVTAEVLEEAVAACTDGAVP